MKRIIESFPNAIPDVVRCNDIFIHCLNLCILVATPNRYNVLNNNLLPPNRLRMDHQNHIVGFTGFYAFHAGSHTNSQAVTK